MTNGKALPAKHPLDDVPSGIDWELEQLLGKVDLPLSDEVWARFRDYWHRWCGDREQQWGAGYEAALRDHPECFVNPGPPPWRPTPYTLWHMEQLAEEGLNASYPEAESRAEDLERELGESRSRSVQLVRELEESRARCAHLLKLHEQDHFGRVPQLRCPVPRLGFRNFELQIGLAAPIFATFCFLGLGWMTAVATLATGFFTAVVLLRSRAKCPHAGNQ